MHLYSGATAHFVADATRNRIAGKLADAFFDQFRYQPAQSEVRSWQNSLCAMAQVVQLADLDDHGVVVELQLPLSSRRLDCLFTGHDAADAPQGVIVELKQWDQIEPSNIEECVTVFLGARLRDVLHPSRQVGNYKRYLQDVHTTFSDGSVGLEACSYLHNMTFAPASVLFDTRFGTLLQQYPAYTGDQADDLASFLDHQLTGGDGLPVLERVLKGRYRPHKRLLDHTARVIRHEPVFILLDEQQVAFNDIIGGVREGQHSTEQTTFLIRGGPGTGKSVIAVNLLAELSADGFATKHATGSKAFTENLRKVVGARASAQFGYFNGFSNVEPGILDALICDEAHRIRETSNSRFTQATTRSDLSQVEELMRAAKVTVFFIDDLQVVRPGEVGSSALIRETAARLRIPVVEHELETQFRCDGSDAFVGWVENTLELRQTPNVLLDPGEEFDFDVVDSPQELEQLIRAKAAAGATARLSAGFCWRWSNPEPDGSLIDDVKVGNWSMPWNARSGAGRLGPGIPKENYWASDPRGVDQVGCVYTAQGFEYDYAGVIWGRDLVYRPRKGWLGQPEYSRDTIVKRAASQDIARFTDLVKNTYRVLLTRGLKAATSTSKTTRHATSCYPESSGTRNSSSSTKASGRGGARYHRANEE
jgi:uncharacterized protein